jgi:hypothetical protein
MNMCRLIGFASPVPTLTEWIGKGKAPVNGVRQLSRSTLLTVPQMGRVLEFHHQDQWRRHDRVIVGLAVLLVPVIGGFTGVPTNAGPDHLLTENCSLWPTGGTDMTSSAAIFLIVVAAGAAIFFLAKIGWAAAGKRRQGRHVQADKLREAAKQETRRVRRQEVLVYQTAVKARAVQDKADVQAAVQAATRRRPPVTTLVE